MKIAVDLRWLNHDTGGISSYAANLVKNLAGLDRVNRYVLVFEDRETEARESGRLMPAKNANFESVIFGDGVFSLTSQLFLPKFLNSIKVDVFHSPDFIAPLNTAGFKLVVTVHDLIPLIHPELIPKSRKARLNFLYRQVTRRILERADAIITDSQNTRKDVMAEFRGLEEKVKVIYLSAAEEFVPIQESGRIEAIKKKFGLGSENILYVGRQEPAKNITGIVKAFWILKHKKKFKGKLVIAGERDRRYPEPYELVKAAGLSDDVVFTGFVERQELPLLYNACDLFVFPSFYEGFGLPVLEAMACGLPVITSSVSALPEVAGDAGVMVVPSDAAALAAAMGEIIADNVLSGKLSKKSIVQAKKFSWKKTAEKTLELYEQTAAKK